jgi:hypothetical protein
MLRLQASARTTSYRARARRSAPCADGLGAGPLSACHPVHLTWARCAAQTLFSCLCSARQPPAIQVPSPCRPRMPVAAGDIVAPWYGAVALPPPAVFAQACRPQPGLIRAWSEIHWHAWKQSSSVPLPNRQAARSASLAPTACRSRPPSRLCTRRRFRRRDRPRQNLRPARPRTVPGA